MSARDEMRNAIRELMAGAVKDQVDATTSDSNVDQQSSAGLDRLCFAYVVGACPAQLLLNTKFSLGPCRWLHDGALARSVPDQERSRIELRALRVIDNALEDIDHEDRKQRKALTRLSDVRASIEQHDLALEDAIAKLAKRADDLAESGRQLRRRGLTEASQKALSEARQLEQNRAAIEERLNRRRSGREQRLRNLPERLPLQECEACGLSYGLDGKNTRYSLHMNGRLHRSVVLLRETSSALREKYSVQLMTASGSGGRGGSNGGGVESAGAKRSKLNLASTLREDFEREESTYSDAEDYDSF